MILTYSHPRFADMITHGHKIHTIREDRHNRWREGLRIQHWMHNPRNVSKNPYPFAQNLNHVCTGTQKITLIASRTISSDLRIWVDGYELQYDEVIELARADGFDSPRQMARWFFGVIADAPQFWTGNLIHWTDKRY